MPDPSTTKRTARVPLTIPYSPLPMREKTVEALPDPLAQKGEGLGERASQAIGVVEYQIASPRRIVTP
jgi:hypothetical protein